MKVWIYETKPDSIVSNYSITFMMATAHKKIYFQHLILTPLMNSMVQHGEQKEISYTHHLTS